MFNLFVRVAGPTEVLRWPIIAIHLLAHVTLLIILEFEKNSEGCQAGNGYTEKVLQASIEYDENNK